MQFRLAVKQWRSSFLLIDKRSHFGLDKRSYIAIYVDENFIFKLYVTCMSVLGNLVLQHLQHTVRYFNVFSNVRDAWSDVEIVCSRVSLFSEKPIL